MTTFMHFLQAPLAHALGWSLLHFCWQGAVIATLLAGALGVLRGRSPQWRYAAAVCALLLMAVVPLYTLARLALATPVAEATTTPSVFDHGRVPHALGQAGVAEPWLEQAVERLDPFVPWVLTGWCAGVILLLSRLNLGLIAARRMRSARTQPAPPELHSALRDLGRRLGMERTVRLAQSAIADVPTVVGWLRPVILIPTGCLLGLSQSQVQAVLAHELAHIRRHDYLVSVFQSVVETLLFYHPAVWWVSKQVRREREHCCDDLAVRISGDSLGYAKALSFLEERRAAVPMIALGANGGVLSMRIKRLLGYSETPAVSRLITVAVLAAVMGGAGLCIGTAARAAGQQPATAESQDMPSKYQKWLGEDVVWIITPEERAAFSNLHSDEERDKFMDMFWLRRSPTPNSTENKVKEEHYRRIAFANSHFAQTDAPGWKSDRGRIYIVYGPPDEINSHPASGSAKAFDVWRYHSIREYGASERVMVEGKEELRSEMVTRKNIAMTFVDDCSCGDYRLQSPAKN